MLGLVVVGTLVMAYEVAGIGVGMMAGGVGMLVGRGCNSKGLIDSCFDVVSQYRCGRLCVVNTIICKSSDILVVDTDNILVMVFGMHHSMMH